MKLISLGRIARPHGFRGAFVTAGDTGRDSAIALADTIHVGEDEKHCRAYSVTETAWMPKGWKVKLEGIESDAEVKKLRGQTLFIDRALLPADEIFEGDLLGCEIIDVTTKEFIGRLAGVEPVISGGEVFQNRWWIETKTGGDLLAVPATNHFIHDIDPASKTIWMENLSDLQ